MKSFFYSILAKLTGKNSKSTPVSVISDQMNEPRQLPLGMQEFEEWSDRIISGVPILSADTEAQKFALATMLMQLGPQESHKPDIFFLKTLLKAAVNQVAHAKMTNIKDARIAKFTKEEADKAIQKATDDAAIIKQQEELGAQSLQRAKLPPIRPTEATNV